MEDTTGPNRPVTGDAAAKEKMAPQLIGRWLVVLAVVATPITGSGVISYPLNNQPRGLLVFILLGYTAGGSIIAYRGCKWVNKRFTPRDGSERRLND